MVSENRNKYKIINSNIIESVFKEEIKPYENDLFLVKI